MEKLFSTSPSYQAQSDDGGDDDDLFLILPNLVYVSSLEWEAQSENIQSSSNASCRP